MKEGGESGGSLKIRRGGEDRKEKGKRGKREMTGGKDGRKMRG